MLADMTATLREHHLVLPADLGMLIKAPVLLEGVDHALDPGFHLATEAMTVLRRVALKRY